MILWVVTHYDAQEDNGRDSQLWHYPPKQPPNTACTRLVGLAAFSGRFLGSGWFRQSGVVSSHPPAGNASRWVAE